MSEIAKQADQAPTERAQTEQAQLEQAQPAETRSGKERPTLHAILDDLAKVKYEVRAAASAGARLAGVAPASFLLPLLRDKNPMIRFAAVEALRLGDFTFNKATVDTLLSKIDDRQNYIAIAAIKALGRKRVRDADEELISCLTMEESKIAAAALLALSEIGTASINEYVEEFLDSGDPIRIRAAAAVVGRGELIQFGGKLFELIGELRDDAEIVPQSDRVNHALIAIRSLIIALDALQYREAIPLLSDLGLNQIGLRSLSLRTLQHMGVDIIEMACQAYETFPSANISKLLADIGDGFDDDDASLAKLNQHLNSNRDRLAELGDRFVEGTKTSGKATKVAHTYAIIQIDQGMSAYIPAVEYRWSPTNDLYPFEEELLRSNEYEVVAIDRERGRIKLSRRRLQPDPLLQFQSKHATDVPIKGTINGIINLGLFVELEPQIVGLLHISRLNFPQDQTPGEFYKVGDAIDVIVEFVDIERRRIRLDLP